MQPSFTRPHVNAYLAHKQRLLPASRAGDIVQVTRDVVALHATNPSGPYLSLWARMPDFQRQALDDALYEGRTLVRALCMRQTLHVVPSDELLVFARAYIDRHGAAARATVEAILVAAGLCAEGEAGRLLERVQQDVLDVLAREGPSTVRDLSKAIPELRAKVQHSAGKAYAGEYTVGSRLVPAMCTLGLLVRARPQGTWRSNLHTYAALTDWLPGTNLDAATPEEARASLVHRYLAAFGPATADDVQWWTGFTVGETVLALAALKADVVEVAVEGMEGTHLMLDDDVQRLGSYAPPRASAPYVFFLPGLDPYIMGYRDRSRFLDPAHGKKVFDRAGNAMPTVWVDGRVVGVWGQRVDGSVVYGLFEEVGEDARALLDAIARRLDAFFDGEYIRPRTQTPFARSQVKPSASIGDLYR
jgi:hypothetical protein